MVRITIDGQDIVFSSKLFVNPTIWKNGAASGKSVEAVKTNGLLNEITTRLTNHYHRILREEDFVTAEKLRNAFLGIGMMEN